jgi:threonine/homoserine/homoserine lactone efflux protein
MLGQIAAFTPAATVVTVSPGRHVWLVTWGWLVARAGAALGRARWRAALERVTGCVLVGFGVRLATTSR